MVGGVSTVAHIHFGEVDLPNQIDLDRERSFTVIPAATDGIGGVRGPCSHQPHLVRL
jgi:hypothetical protein